MSKEIEKIIKRVQEDSDKRLEKTLYKFTKQVKNRTDGYMEVVNSQ